MEIARLVPLPATSVSHQVKMHLSSEQAEVLLHTDLLVGTVVYWEENEADAVWRKAAAASNLT